jgi:hypothetical protein
MFSFDILLNYNQTISFKIGGGWMEEGFVDLTVIKEMFTEVYRCSVKFKYLATDITTECVTITNHTIQNHEYYRQFVSVESDIQISFTG